MIIDINLLPQKEEKNKPLLVLAIIFAVILLLGFFSMFWLSRSYENQIATIDQRIASTESLIASEQQKKVTAEATDSLTKLDNTVKWAKAYPLKTIPVLQELTSLLPERGFIKTFTYEETGKIVLTVQFEQSREAAYYLSSILDSNWISDAKLNSLQSVTKFYDDTMDENFDESHVTNETYIPRYEGEFEITLNQDVIKNELKDTESESLEQKEGTDS